MIKLKVLKYLPTGIIFFNRKNFGSHSTYKVSCFEKVFLLFFCDKNELIKADSVEAIILKLIILITSNLS